MLLRHKINGVLCEVDDIYGEELLATGHFVRPRKRAKAEAPADDVIPETVTETPAPESPEA